MVLDRAETWAAEKWLYQTLTTWPGLIPYTASRWFSHVAPQGTARPYGIFQQQAQSDLRALGAVRIWTNLVYVVYVVHEGGSWDPLDEPAAELDKALHGKSGVVDDARILSSEREAPFALTEIVAGVQFRRLGGRYRLKVQGAS